MTGPRANVPDVPDGIPLGGELAASMGIRILERSPLRSVATMPAEGNRQDLGVINGGAYCVLAETLGSLSALAHAGPGMLAYGVDINATHTRAVAAGTVTATCTAVHLGSTITVHEVVIEDEEGRRVSTARITNLLRPQR